MCAAAEDLARCRLPGPGERRDNAYTPPDPIPPESAAYCHVTPLVATMHILQSGITGYLVPQELRILLKAEVVTQLQSWIPSSLQTPKGTTVVKSSESSGDSPDVRVILTHTVQCLYLFLNKSKRSSNCLLLCSFAAQASLQHGRPDCGRNGRLAGCLMCT